MRTRRKIFSLAFAIAMLVTPVVVAAPVSAAKKCDPDKFTETSTLGGDYSVNGQTKHGYCDDGEGGGVYEILYIVLNVLTIGVGVLGTLGIVISGIQYLTAGDNEQQVATAKKRIVEVVIGLAIYAVMYVVLQWLIPGGIFNGS